VLKPGEKFAGYRIVRALGAGGMGEVYLADHPRLLRQDAIKVLSAQLSADERFIKRFRREADLSASLWHPHIVGVHDRGEFNNRLWLSMDFVDGTDAARMLADRPQGLPVAEVSSIVEAIAEALDFAHERGMLHRDVKPANILLTSGKNKRILLADFGIGREIANTNGLTATGMTLGTVSYAAPEQLMGENLDGRVDQYALAATAYHLLSGQPVFEHSNPTIVISRHLNCTPARLADSHPEFAFLDPVLQQALAKDPAERFASCVKFADALRLAATAVKQRTAGTSTDTDISSSAPTRLAPVLPEVQAAAAPTQAAPTPKKKRSSVVSSRSTPIAQGRASAAVPVRINTVPPSRHQRLPLPLLVFMVAGFSISIAVIVISLGIAIKTLWFDEEITQPVQTHQVPTLNPVVPNGK
jgi:serine/threonine-protein kinase